MTCRNLKGSRVRRRKKASASFLHAVSASFKRHHFHIQGTSEETVFVRANYKCMYSQIDIYYMLKSIVAVAG